jgi:hypothetical protein
MKNKNILTRGHNFFLKNQLNEGEKRGRWPSYLWTGLETQRK